MSRIELYTPWREPSERLQARTVGREALVNRLKQGGDALRSGKPALPLYLFGPRGIGKSHLVALLREDFERQGLRVTIVVEDIAAITSAAELLERAQAGGDQPTWMRILDPRITTPPTRTPTVLLIEGLDRRLAELGSNAAGREQRQRLRQAWDQNNTLWVIGTGVELTGTLTDAGEPFFGFFDAEAVGPLAEKEARHLMDLLVPEPVRSRPHWISRREALLPLAGGSPRVLATLADSCAAPEAPDAASDALLGAVDRFTAHYQMRFRDLPGLGQRIVELLASWPRDMGPSEIARHLSAKDTTIATTTRRLSDDGVLSRREENGSTRYRIAEPLFRYWLEYRTGPWETTRVAVATSLLQALFSPADIVDRWWKATEADPVVQAAVKKLPVEATNRIRPEAHLALREGDGSRLVSIVQKAADAGHIQAVELPGVLKFIANDPAIFNQTRDCFRGRPMTQATLTFAHNIYNSADTPRSAFTQWLRSVSATRAGLPWSTLTTVVFSALDERSGPGTNWVLSRTEIEKVIHIPFLRGQLLQRGRLRSHAAILDPHDFSLSAVQAGAADLGLLLSAAMSREGDELVEKVLRAATDQPQRPPPPLPPNSTPGTPCPRRPDLLARWCILRLQSEDSLFATLSWARSFSELEEALFEEVCAAIKLPKPGAQRRMDDFSARSGLVALGLTSMPRLVRILEVLPESWRAVGAMSRALVQQIGTAGPGQLHPELEALRRRLN